MLAAAVVTAAVAVIALQAPQDPKPANPLHEQLGRAVDLATAAERVVAADELAKTAGVTLDEWLAACASFGTFAPPEPGPSRHAGTGAREQQAVPGAAVLLREFVERFDRTFRPVARVLAP